MLRGDVRGLLQYVPQFRGKVFIIIIDTQDSTLAETMLDLLSLQNIGVQLVIGSTVHSTDDLLDRAAEVELNVETVSNNWSPEEAATTLNRGQAVVINFSNKEALSPDTISFAAAISARKIILIDAQGETEPRGAIRAADVKSDQSTLLASAAQACKQGVPRVHLLDGKRPAVLLDELFSNEGVGTMVYADSYRTIRPLREEDIVELLGMIGRSVRNAHLVPRGYNDIEQHLGDYSVMEIDGNVVGSIALRIYRETATAEIACLYVKQDHEHHGYGTELVKHAEQRARELNLTSVFSLTNRAADFFQNELGYHELPADQIPAHRHQQLLASGRDSRVFGKVLEV